MRTVFDPRQLTHAPENELHNGALTPYFESPARAEAILSAVGETEPPVDHGRAPIEAVHDARYVAFLERVYGEWRADGRKGDAIPYVFPTRGQRPNDFKAVDGQLANYSFDAATPIVAETWEAAYWNAQTALTALDGVMKSGEASAFALCRPPGHHAGRDYMGGYCYLNNAAIAAEAARSQGAERVAILDVDYHHGNGTQDIFYDRSDVFFASIHANPATDFPYFWGRADERGEGAGEGATLNRPLPHGTAADGYLEALDDAVSLVDAFAPDLVIVSFGADTYEHDPISFFKLTVDDYAALGERIAKLSQPKLVVMEGGYAVDALGEITTRFLEGLSG